MATNNTDYGPSGWAYFAVTMMALAGTLNIVYGLVLLVNDDYAALFRAGALGLNFDTAGALLLVVGVIQVAVALGLLGGYRWARVVGVILAAGAIVANISVLAVYPVLTLLIIAADLLVIYALTARGEEYSR